MAGDDSRKSPLHEREDRLLRIFRIISGVVILVLLAFSVLIDPLGRLFIAPDFHVSEVIVGTLMGSLLVVLGFEGIRRLPGAK